MADQSNNDSLTSELESRLDDLFREEDGPEPIESEPKSEEYPLSELKNLVLSIDWEITDKDLADFVTQVKKLSSQYQNDKIVATFLQILGSLGEYIKTRRGKAHPKTFKTLNSVFARLDEVVRTGDMSGTEKKKNLHIAMKRYKLLREEIAKDKTRASRGSKVVGAKKTASQMQKPSTTVDDTAVPPPRQAVERRPAEPAVVVSEPAISEDALVKAVGEIKAYIRAEIDKLRGELKQLK